MKKKDGKILRNLDNHQLKFTTNNAFHAHQAHTLIFILIAYKDYS